MNAPRRKAIAVLITELMRIQLEVQELSAKFEDICSEEQEAYDNLPERLQDAERGETMQAHIENLQTTVDDLNDFASAEFTSEY